MLIQKKCFTVIVLYLLPGGLSSVVLQQSNKLFQFMDDHKLYSYTITQQINILNLL